MNAENILQSYLDGALSHSEERRLKELLSTKKRLSPEEQILLTLLTPTAAPSEPDETWWSDEGCASYDALVGDADRAKPLPVISAARPRRHFALRLLPLAAAMAVVVFGVWQLFPSPSSSPSSAEHALAVRPVASPSVPALRPAGEPTHRMAAPLHATPPPMATAVPSVAATNLQAPTAATEEERDETASPDSLLTAPLSMIDTQLATAWLDDLYLEKRYAEHWQEQLRSALVRLRLEVQYQLFLRQEPEEIENLYVEI